MIAVIFEALPDGDANKAEYLAIAADLKPILEHIDGFISIERFKSLADPEKLLSLSFWRDEESIKQWRNIEMHRLAQKKGRANVFKNYRLRIAGVVRDYGMFSRTEAPVDSKHFHSDEKQID